MALSRKMLLPDRHPGLEAFQPLSGTAPASQSPAAHVTPWRPTTPPVPSVAPFLRGGPETTYLPVEQAGRQMVLDGVHANGGRRTLKDPKAHGRHTTAGGPLPRTGRLRPCGISPHDAVQAPPFQPALLPRAVPPRRAPRPRPPPASRLKWEKGPPAARRSPGPKPSIRGWLGHRSRHVGHQTKPDPSDPRAAGCAALRDSPTPCWDRLTLLVEVGRRRHHANRDELGTGNPAADVLKRRLAPKLRRSVFYDRLDARLAVRCSAAAHSSSGHGLDALHGTHQDRRSGSKNTLVFSSLTQETQPCRRLVNRNPARMKIAS